MGIDTAGQDELAGHVYFVPTSRQPIVERFFFHCDGTHRDLHSFPTRRSSDLYSPLGHGFLTGKIRSPQELADDDWRKTNPRFTEGNFEKNLRLVDEVEAVASEVEASPAQVRSESTRLNSSHRCISYAVFCLKK